MTCIAWDGLTLAVDRQANRGTAKNAVTKLCHINGNPAAYAGSMYTALRIIRYLREGGRWPAKATDDVEVVVIIDHKAHVYYGGSKGEPIVYEGAYATGCGGDFAQAAMYLGKGAREAVQVAAALCPSVGMGVNTAKG